MKTFYTYITLIILFLLYTQNNIAQTVPLNGAYTIGTGGNFATLDTAVKSLIARGINGAVVFNLKNGDYNEQISIPEIVGSSATNTITFQSETGDSSQVKIFFADNWGVNHVIRLNGADNIIFRKLTIETSGDYYGIAVVIDSSANNVRFESNILRNQYFSADCGEGCNQYNTLVYANSDFYNNNNTYTNNLFENGSYGIFYGYSKGLTIANNLFINQIYTSLYINNQDSLEINNNIIRAISTEYNYYALNISNCTIFSIRENKIFSSFSGYGISLSNCNGAASNYGTTTNNFISIKGNSEENAVSLNTCSYVNFVFNNVSVHSGNSMWCKALLVDGGNNINLKNNNICNSGSGFSLYVLTPASIDTSDYNNFYTSGNSLAYWTENRDTLSNLQLASGKDQHSVSTNPFFVSENDLHTFNVGINGKGTPVNTVKKDIDGEIRNISLPDIGADEFTPPAIDAGIASLVDANKPFARGDRNISIYIKNFGTSTLLNASVHWTLNGVTQNDISWTGNLTSGQSDLISLGNFTFDKNVDNVVKCWTTLPNGIADNLNHNDTLTVILRPSISGIYTIGGTNPDFNSFLEAFSFLRNQVYLGNIVFKVRNGAYNEQLYVNGITTTSENSTITFEAESGDSSQVILSSTSTDTYSNYTLYLYGANYLTFNKITFKALNPTYGRIISIDNSHHNTFKNCVFQGVSIYSGENGALIYSGGYSTNNYNKFINNRFIGGSSGIFYYAKYNAYGKGTRIENNIFEGQSDNSILVSYQDSIIIHNNSITANSSYSDFYGISCKSGSNKLEITKNKIQISGWGNGINMDNSGKDINSQALIANNFISVTFTGIFLYYSEYVNVYNNTVNITGTSSGRSLDIQTNNNTQGNINIVNNIFANFSGGGYCYSYPSTSPIKISDYNNFYTTGQYLAVGNGYNTNLSDLQTNTGKDAHSKSIDPKFVSATDLHVSEVALNNAGYPLAEVSSDFDGDLRSNANPDIGADEFSPVLNNNAGLFAFENLKMPITSGSRNILVSLKNFGGDTLKTVAIDWNVNGIGQPRFNWTGALKSGDTIIVSIGNYNFGIKNKFEITAWTTLPNGGTDPENANDTLKIANLYAALNGTYTIGGTTPDFTDFTDAANTLTQGGITGAVTLKIRPGTYNEQVTLQKIKGTSASNTLLFEPENGDSTSVILNFSANATKNYTLFIDSAGFITINKLNIKSLDANNGNVIQIATYNASASITNSTLESVSANSVIISTISRANSCRIINNNIINGSYGIFFYNGINDLRIENNSFSNQRNRGIEVFNPDTIIIRSNIIEAFSGSLNYTAVSTGGYCRQIKIEKNKINIAGGGIGLLLNNINGSDKTNTLIANNFIHIGGTSISSGINCSSSYNLNIINNSINITNTNLNSRAFYIYNQYNTSIDLLNNILANTGGGYTLYSYYKNLLGNTDYNNLYTTGANLAFWDGDKTNLTELKFVSNQETHSLSVNPQFVSATNLHVNELTLNGSGLPVSGVTDDIDGELRDKTFPDIGADEFENNKHDVGISSALPVSGCMLGNNEPVTVTLKNYGGHPETGFQVVYIFDKSDTLKETISQTIPAGGSTNITLNKLLNLSAIKSYHVKTYILYPGDENKDNDTLEYFIDNMPKLQLKHSSDTLICNGSSIKLSVAGAYSYLWNNGKITSIITVNPGTTTSYTVTGKNLFNCVATDTVIVHVSPLPAAPLISASGSLNICGDSSVSLTSSYPLSITWNTGETTPSITVNKGGIYYVTYRDSLNCSSISLASKVTKEPLPRIIPADTTVCSTDTFQIRVDNAINYVWSTGATTQNIIVNPVNNTTYNVIATTAFGCKKTLDSKITIFPSKMPGLVSDMIPENGSLDISQPNSISWLPASNATNYDLFIWPLNETKPNNAFASNLKSIRFDLDTFTLVHGKAYNWQVVSKYYGCEATPGPLQTFSVRSLPDLVVSNVQIPKSAFTGRQIEITWDVKNQGLGSTLNQPWIDNITFSLDSTTIDDFHTLGNITNMTYLEAGQTYSKKATFNLPDYKDGQFHVFAMTDRYRQVLETNNSNNIGRSNKPLVVSLAPVPDLYVSDIFCPSNFFSEDTINISWKVLNKGKWRTEKTSWVDRVFISKDYNTSKRHHLGDFAHTGDTIRPGENYTASHSVVIPEGIIGKYYLYIETDVRNDIQEHAYDGNNLSQSDSVNVILRPPADLELSNLIIPQNSTNTGTANIRWKVTNIGNSSPSDKEWYDAIYLSKSPKFDPSKSVKFYFRRSAYPAGIPLNMEYTASEYIQIPNTIVPGDYYIYIKTDNSDEVFEYIFEENNFLRSDTTIQISIAPYPDLIVTGISLPDSSGAGETIPFNYMVTNKGTSVANGTWSDRIYISDGVLDVYLKEIKRYDKLNIDSSYIITTQVTLPSGFIFGSNKYQIYVKADTSKTVFEYSGENNNKLADSIFIKPSDLSVTNVSIPALIYSGSSINTEFNVTNVGNSSSPAASWYDKALIFDSLNHVVYSTKIETGWVSYRVKPGKSYTSKHTLNIPEGISGNYYLQLHTDIYNNNRERIAENNTKRIPITITLRKPTDLIVNSYTVPANGISGQPISISWTIKNTGSGNTLANQWIDVIVLSKDSIISEGDIQLTVYRKNEGLTSGESYNKSEETNLPISTLGNYYVIIKTDYSIPGSGNGFGNEFEMNAENNNTSWSLISITQAPPSNLTVTNITVPANAITGQPVTIGWTVKNGGPNKADGYLTDMVYFSKDKEWDIEDPFFGEKPFKVSLDPGQETFISLTTELTSAGVGNYYVVVRTDNRNNINEVNEFDNTLASSTLVKVETPVLKLNVTENSILRNDKGLFYRIEIPDSLVDETLLVTLNGDTISGANEMFISFNRLPDRSDYDFNSKVPSYGNQEVIVPVLKKGDYYLLIHGNVASGNQQNISVLANKINFQIRKVDANKGGNRGTLTSQLYGAKFSPKMIVKLRYPSNTITADTLIFIDATKVFVTFNLMNATLGKYDVLAIDAKGDTAVLKNGFEVEENSPFGLVTSVKAPGEMVRSTKTTIAIQFANEGNNDLSIPRFKLISINHLPVALTKKGLDNLQTIVEFELREIDGPQHILRPGAVNSVYIWVHATSGGRSEFKFE